MEFDDLVKELPPPTNRIGKSVGEMEHHLYEGAVMVAYTMHLMRTQGVTAAEIHPDGEHGKQFDFQNWLGLRGFRMVSSQGATRYGGTYRDEIGRTILIDPRPGLGDVVAAVSSGILTAECKGGIINTRHSGQVSRLYRGLCEAVGLLMASPQVGRQIAVVPYTQSTFRLATRMAPRCAVAGIEIALVKSRGEVIDIATFEG